MRTWWAAFAFAWRAAPKAAAARLAITVLDGVLPVLAAWLGKLLFDEIAKGRAADAGYAITVALAGALCTGAFTLAGRCSGYAGLVVAQAITLAAERRIYRAVNDDRSLTHLEDPAYLDRLQLAERAALAAPQAVAALAATAVESGVRVAGYLGALLVLWPPMAAIVVAAVIPGVLLKRSLARHGIATAEGLISAQRWRARYRILLTDPRTGQEVRLFGLGGEFFRRMLAALGRATAAERAVERRGVRTDVALAGIAVLTLAGGTVLAVVEVTRGRLSVGDLTLFTASVAGVQSALSSVLGQYGQARQEVGLFAHFVAVTATPPHIAAGGAEVTPLKRGIEFEDVWFRYGTGPWVLAGLDLTVPHGATLGLVGLNGAGKSTLVKLLCRFHDPERGRIRWDGVDLRELDVDELRRRIGATFQDYVSYDLTAAENIGVGDLPRIGDLAAIRAAARLSGIDDVLAARPSGYDTLLSRAFTDEEHDATTLSGGQWQRVALARTFLRAHADLLILDEPSSGLDAEAEHEIHENLACHRDGVTTLLVSHRLATLRSADTIVVLAGGRVTESGRHDALMSAGGTYARLFALQAAGYQDERVAR